MEWARGHRIRERERDDRLRAEARAYRLARDAHHGQRFYTNRDWFADQSEGVRTEIRLRAGHTKSEILRAEAARGAARRRAELEENLRAAHAARREQERVLESAAAEESRLRAQWEAAATALEEQKAVVKSAWSEERRLLAAFDRIIAADRAEQSEIPESSLERREETVAPTAIIVGNPTPTPATEELDAPSEQKEKVTLAIEPAPVVSAVAPATQNDITVVTPAAEELEAPLELKEKAATATHEPEAPLERMEKVATAAEELETPTESKEKAAQRDGEAHVTISAEEPGALAEQSVEATSDVAAVATAFDESKPPMEGRVKKVGRTNAGISKPKTARSKAKKVVRFRLPSDPKPSSTGRERAAITEQAQEPEKAEHGELAEELETASLESSTGDQGPVVEGCDLEAELDKILTNSPKPSLEERATAEDLSAQEPEKAQLGELAEEPETACFESAARDDEGFDLSEISVALEEIVAEELEPLMEGRAKADDHEMAVEDAPEASLGRKAAEDTVMAAHEPEQEFLFEFEEEFSAMETAALASGANELEHSFFGAEDAMETVPEANATAYEPEPQSFGEDSVMETAAMVAYEPSAETSFEEEAAEVTAAMSLLSISDVELSHDWDDAENVRMAGSLEGSSAVLVEQSSADLEHPFARLPETAVQLALPAQESDLAEMADLPADDLMSEPMEMEEEEGRADDREAFSRENNGLVPMGVEAPMEHRVGNDSMMAEQGGLATIREQIRLAQAHADQLAQLQVARQAEEWEAAQAQAAFRLAQETEAARLQAEEQARQQAWLQDQALMAEQIRQAEEARIREQARLAEEALIQEQARLLEQAMAEEQARRQHQARLEEEGRLAEQARVLEQQRLQEQARIAEQARLEEQARFEEQARIVEEGCRHDQARLEEQARLDEQARRFEMPEEERAMEDRIRQELVEAMLRAGMRDVFPVPAPPPRPDSSSSSSSSSTIIEESDHGAGRYGIDYHGSDDEDTSLNEEDLAMMGVPVGWHNPDDSDRNDSLFDGELSELDEEDDDVPRIVRDEETGVPWVVRGGLSFPLPNAPPTNPTPSTTVANTTPSTDGDTSHTIGANTLATGVDNTSSAGGQTGATMFSFGNTTTSTTPTPTTLSAVPPAPEFAFRADQQAPARRTVQAKPAPAGEAGPSQPAVRKILPARGTKVSKEARQRVLQEFKGNLVQGAEDTECELLDDEEIAEWIADQESRWAAETLAEQAAASQAGQEPADPKGKGKAVEPTKAEKRAAARAKALAEFKEIEERCLQSGQEVQRAIDSCNSQETVFRRLYMGEEAQFDPRVGEASRVARSAFAMGQAAEEARRAA